MTTCNNRLIRPRNREVAHDMDEDEYVFQATIDDTESKEGPAFLKIAKKTLGDKLRPLFQQYPKAMLETHGQDLLANDGDSAPSSGATTPAVAATKSTASVSSTTAPSTTVKSTSAATSVSGLSFNTSTVKVDGEFQCSAEDLFDFLTNPAKIPLWSRNPAKMAPTVGAPVELFGGNITGKVLAVTKNESLKMDWRVGTWPENYYGQLEMLLKQGTNSTTLTLRLTGCPVGMEDATETNLTVYYLNALRSIGSVNRWSLFISSAVPMAISVGLIGALGAAFYYGPSGPGGKQ